MIHHIRKAERRNKKGMASSPFRRWLVEHPAATAFEWKQGSTFGSSIPFLVTAVLTYLSLTLLIHRRLLPLPAPPPSALRAASAAHSLILLLISLTMSIGCSLSAIAYSPSPAWIFCFPSPTPARGPVFFWAYVFYLSKIYEFVDTLLILLAGGRRLTFLHVYHHAVVVVMCYLWLSARQSLMPVALVTNAGVHVVMYAYYFCSGVGWRWPPRWKRAVTELQIWQFGFSFAASVVFLWLHFRGEGCEGMGAWLFNAGFNASLLALFVNFHSAAYAGGGRRRKAEEKDR